MNQSKNLYRIFEQTATAQPDHIACLDLGRKDRCTYAQLSVRIDAAAERLNGLGVLPGQCVGLHYGSGLNYIILAYAIWRCGGTVVPIATELVASEKLEVCQKIRLNGILTAVTGSAVFEPFLASAPIPFQDGSLFLPIRPNVEQPPEFAEIDAAFIRFTSGTTSTAKGVVLSHATVFDRIHAANDALKIGEADSVVWLLSMSYHFTVSIVAYLTFGATILLCSDHFGSTIVEEAAANGGTLIYGSPQHYSLMASDRSGIMLDRLRLAISTASALKPEVAAAFQRRFAMPLCQAYGIIEIGLPCINLAGETLKPGSVGQVLSAYELRLRDIGSGDLRAIDVRGKGLFDAYYNPWKRQEQLSADGWFETGDMGRFDEDGYLYITGRSKEMISVGGMKFFPLEVEAVLERHPLVAEAYVYSEADARFGEIPVALVKLKPNSSYLISPDELRAYCHEVLTAFKIPRRIAFTDELPRTASGKLKRQTALSTEDRRT